MCNLFKELRTLQNNFLKDGDSSQNLHPVKIAMERFGAVQFDVLPRSPDCNPFKNVFSFIERRLKDDAIELNITQESYNDFLKRVQETI